MIAQDGKKYLVFAGNHRQFENWRHENQVQPRDAVYVGRVEDLMGRRASQYTVVHYGTYFDNPAFMSDYYQVFMHAP